MPGRREHHIVVESELRNPPDLRRLSRALIKIAREKGDDARTNGDSQIGADDPVEQPDP